MMVNVLDIDLDFFLNPRPRRLARGDRLSAEEYEPWSRQAVDTFLTQRCKLSKANPLPGSVVVCHHELFDQWKQLIASGELVAPFHLTHVDSHADMGMGDASYMYIMCDLLHQERSSRTDPKRGGWSGLGEGNFVSFAVACQWIGRITYVHHPDVPRQNRGVGGSYQHDIGDSLFRDGDPHSGIIQLKKYPRHVAGKGVRLTELSPQELQPEVPIELVDGESYRADEPFAFLFAAHSPRYTPPTADPLLEVIRQFIEPLEVDSTPGC